MILPKKLLILIISFFIFDYVIGFSLLKLSTISKIRYSRLYKEEINADVVFIGNSRAINSFYTPHFDKLSGLTSINLAYNGLTLPIAKVFIGDYLQRNKLPKVIVMEVTFFEKSYEVLPNFKQYIFDSPSLQKLMKEHYPYVYYTSLISKSYTYNSEYFLRTLYYINKTDQDWINRYTISKEYYESIKTIKRLELINKPDDISMIILRRIIEECNDKGVKVVLVLSPIIDKCRNESDIDKYISFIENRSGLKIIDLSDLLDDINMFADTIHTNEQGAFLIAEKLIEEGVLLTQVTSKQIE